MPTEAALVARTRMRRLRLTLQYRPDALKEIYVIVVGLYFGTW